MAVGADDFNLREFVPLADFEVRLVVRGRHLEHAGAELKVHVLVANDRNQLLLTRQFRRQRTHDMLADVFRVTRIFRIHGHGGVAGNGFGTSGCNR